MRAGLIEAGITVDKIHAVGSSSRVPAILKKIIDREFWIVVPTGLLGSTAIGAWMGQAWLWSERAAARTRGRTRKESACVEEER